MKVIRRPLFWFNLAMWLISIVIAGFLIQLGSLVMSDVPTAGQRISRNDFVDTAKLQSVDAEIKILAETSRSTKDRLEDARFRFKSLSLDYDNQRTSFEAWIKTRTATESDGENPEVIKRVNAIEAIKIEERKAQRVVEDLGQQAGKEGKAMGALQSRRREILNDAYVPYDEARKYEVLKVFMARLALTLPLLLISGWLILKRRKSKYWPVYRGFVLFSLFAFFVELVPYLPSYGGYVRYIVGILIALVVARYLTKWMEKYLKSKKDEQNKPETEKRKQIEYEVAVKKISSGVCPSCDRQFAGEKLKNPEEQKAVDLDYCVHCGFCLYNKCQNCGTRENSFFNFCGSCGTTTQNVMEPANG